MAEAVVDQPLMSRFFCHKCCVEIDTLLPDYTCPECECGFIEEMARGNNDGGPGTDGSSIGLDLSDIRIRPTTSNITLEIHDISADEADEDVLVDISANPGQQQRSTNRNSVYPNRRLPILPPIRGIRRITGRSPIRQGQSDQYLDQLIHEVLQIIRTPHLMYTGSRDDQPPVMILRNAGDYVWGRDGWDAVVTQLLTQMDPIGPPPLPRKQIDELPTINVTQTQVDCKLQCSVCWEDYKLDESVKQLPCEHIYHVPCIVPWLELHGTCPICRQNLGDQNSEQANQDTAGSTLAALFSAANETTGITSSSSSASTGNNSSDNSWSEL